MPFNQQSRFSLTLKFQSTSAPELFFKFLEELNEGNKNAPPQKVNTCDIEVSL